MTTHVHITVAIPTYGRDRVLLDTVQCVLSLIKPGDELFIVDQTLSHNDVTESVLSAWHRKKAIRWVRLQRPNLPHARNIALREAANEVVLFLDDDVVPSSGLLEAHRRCYNDPSICAVTGQCLGPGKKPFAGGACIATNPLKAFLARSDRDERETGVWVVSGCNHSVRRDIALGVGGYDEAFCGPAIMEDYDFGYRLASNDHAIVYEPRAALVHLRIPSAGCRVTDKTHSEWRKPLGILIFSLRHGVLFQEKANRLWVALRYGPLRRVNVVRPWRQPLAWLSFAYAFVRAVCAAKKPVWCLAGSKDQLNRTHPVFHPSSR